MLTIPSLIERHIPYQSTSLVENTPYSLAMDQNASITFDKALIDYLDAMETNTEEVERPLEEIAEEDKVLMTAPRDGQESKGMYTRKPNVTWLRRSEYIGTEIRGVSNRKEGVENKFAMSAASAKKIVYDTLEGQLAGIENTFKPVSMDARHPQTNARVKKIIPILPDMRCWENTYTVGQFSAEPADEARMSKRRALVASGNYDPSKKPRLSELDATDRGILRPMVNPHDSDDTYLAWFLPDHESTKRLVGQKESMDDVDIDSPLTYNAVCDYEYKNDGGSGTKNLLITMHDDGEERALYNPIRSKMVVRKKRALSAKFKYLDQYEKPNILTVKYTN